MSQMKIGLQIEFNGCFSELFQPGPALAALCQAKLITGDPALTCPPNKGPNWVICEGISPPHLINPCYSYSGMDGVKNRGRSINTAQSHLIIISFFLCVFLFYPRGQKNSLMSSWPGGQIHTYCSTLLLLLLHAFRSSWNKIKSNWFCSTKTRPPSMINNGTNNLLLLASLSVLGFNVLLHGR